MQKLIDDSVIAEMENQAPKCKRPELDCYYNGMMDAITLVRKHMEQGENSL